MVRYVIYGTVPIVHPAWDLGAAYGTRGPVVRYVSQKKGSSSHFEQISIPALGESL